MTGIAITLRRPGARFDEFDPTRDIAVAPNEIVRFEYFQVVIDHTGRRNPQLGLNVANRRRIVILIEKGFDEIENRLLTSR